MLKTKYAYKSIHTYIHAYIHTYLHTYKHTYIHRYIETVWYAIITSNKKYLHITMSKTKCTYTVHDIHTYIHTYIQSICVPRPAHGGTFTVSPFLTTVPAPASRIPVYIYFNEWRSDRVLYVCTYVCTYVCVQYVLNVCNKWKSKSFYEFALCMHDVCIYRMCVCKLLSLLQYFIYVCTVCMYVCMYACN